MVGRFDDELRRTLLYYYYTLVMGDAEDAARYLAAVAEPGRREPTRTGSGARSRRSCRRWTADRQLPRLLARPS